MSKPTVAIIGASNNRSKYSNKSLRAHLDLGYEVYPVNPNEKSIEGLTCYPTVSDIPLEHLTRISVYVPPHVGIELLEEIKNLSVEEIWFNPGSENEELVRRADELDLDIIRACSIVDLGVSPSAYPEN